MKNVLMFPGQGSQFRGMGAELFSKFPEETRQASDILGYDIKELCINDPEKKLKNTKYTQPAVYIVNHLLFKEYNQLPDYVLGHSLGEYNALLVAGAYDFCTGLKLVKKRAELMGSTVSGSMVAVIGMTISEINEQLGLENFGDVDIANYNTPTQIVLSGSEKSIQKIREIGKKNRHTIIPLRVSAPFHSQFMKEAATKFSEYIREFDFYDLKIPVISNYTGQPYDKNSIKNLLCDQINNSVKWVDSIRFLLQQGAGNFKELGRPLLSKMVNEISQKYPVIETPKNHNTVREKKNNQGTKLGSQSFKEDYGVDYAYVTGSMYKGIASKGMVVRMAKANMLAFLGTGGMSLQLISQNLDDIQSQLTNKQTFGANLLHNIENEQLEFNKVELFIEKKVKNIEASAFLQVTKPLVYFLATGLEEDENGHIKMNHKILAKLSRPEVARSFMSPPSEHLIEALIEEGKITKKQADLARRVPVASDICVEADSGGHTDAGIPTVLLPTMQFLRNELREKYKYNTDIRVGLAGGIGTPQAVASAFIMGADFVMTGSINQCTLEANTSNLVKDLLMEMNIQDTSYCSAGDLFEMGAKIQVLRKGVLFPFRANKLYKLYKEYNDLTQIPLEIVSELEKKYFEMSISEVWGNVKEHLEKTDRSDKVAKAIQNPRYKMTLIFKWYFYFSSEAALSGSVKDKVNFQIHTGPSLGSFNQWVKNTPLEHWKNRHVDEIGEKLMEAAALEIQKALTIVQD